MNTKKIKYKKELDNYNNQDIIYTTGEYFAATLPFEFVGTKQTLTNENKSFDIPVFINNLILLNPDADLQTIVTVTNSKLNKLYFQSLNYNQLVEMVEKIYINKENLKPLNMTIKERWINPECENKMKVHYESIVNETLNKINYYFTDEISFEKEKINYEKIAQNTGLSVKSIQRHITPEQKQLMKEHNLKIKQSKEIKLNLSDCDFLFNEIPAPAPEKQISVCPIKPVKPIKEICDNSNTIKEFEQYIITNNNNQYQFSDETFRHITDHFNVEKINWLKSNICECVELKKKAKLYERTRREIQYINN